MWQLIIEIKSYAMLYKLKNRRLKLSHDDDFAVSKAFDWSVPSCRLLNGLHNGLQFKKCNIERQRTTFSNTDVRLK